MKILSIDSSTEKLGVAVSDQGHTINYAHLQESFRHSKRIIGLIDRVLKKSKTALADIDVYAIGTGPGSFTGLRIGLATIKAFAVTFAKPVVAVPSFDVIAQNVSGVDTRVQLIYDAKKENVYYAEYFPGKGILARRGRIRLVPRKRLVSVLKKNAKIIGDGICENDLREIFKTHRLSLTPKRLWYPDIRRQAPLAWQKYLNNETVSYESLEPLYLYPHDCAVRKKNS